MTKRREKDTLFIDAVSCCQDCNGRASRAAARGANL
jgi:hypothetical protein